MSKLSISDLTPRQHDVANLLSQGLTNKEIAQQLNLSTDTVKFHVLNLLKKFDTRSRVVVAVTYGKHLQLIYHQRILNDLGILITLTPIYP